MALPPSVDLRFPRGPSAQWPSGLPGLPPCFDQGEESSCGANMGDAMMCYLFPEVVGGFSRHQIYRDVRVIERTGNEDAGVETRDVFRALSETGAAPEKLWPYEKHTFSATPPQSVYDEAKKYRLDRYSRLVSASNYLQCLATGFPFGLGIMLHESFESDQVSRTGIMPIPKRDEKEIGGHDVLAVGYVLNFKTDPLFLSSGVDPALVSDEMILIRNSWGDGKGPNGWSPHYRGHFFMSLQYAMDKITGNDAWTGRR